MIYSKKQEEMTKILVGKVDSTIESVCECIHKEDMPPEAYADTVKALAALVEARAKLI